MKAYLDNNATTMLDPRVLDAMQPFFSSRYGNPSSIHSFGGNVSKDIKAARESLAALINSGSEEIIFTSGGTESDNLAIRGVLDKAKKENKTKIITSSIEHPAVRSLCHNLQNNGFGIVELPVDIDNKTG